MTKEEAMKLEKRCDRIMSGYLGRECSMSMALTGRLKVCFNDGDYITWDITTNTVNYVRYVGFYDVFVNDIHMIEECIADNRDIFEKLLWSYGHQHELE